MVYADNNIQYWFVRFTGSVDPDFNGELSGISTNTIEFYPEIVISNKEIRVTEPVDMEIYAISGYKVAEQKNTTVITTQNMERGAYIVKCTSSKGKVVTKKFIKITLQFAQLHSGYSKKRIAPFSYSIKIFLMQKSKSIKITFLN